MMIVGVKNRVLIALEVGVLKYSGGNGVGS